MELLYNNYLFSGCIDLITPLTKLECKAFKKYAIFINNKLLNLWKGFDIACPIRTKQLFLRAL